MAPVRQLMQSLSRTGLSLPPHKMQLSWQEQPEMYSHSAVKHIRKTWLAGGAGGDGGESERSAARSMPLAAATVATLLRKALAALCAAIEYALPPPSRGPSVAQ